MKELTQKVQQKIDQLENEAGDLFSNNDVEEAYKLREEAWTLYPDPKIDYSDAYNTAKYIVEEALVLRDLNRAKIWLNEMIKINNNLHISDEELEYYLGRYYFENKEYQKALASFKEVVEEAGFRYFEDEDPKYLDFYRNPKKYME